ncbi:hypothetical protein H9633_10150 [Microbacterium sp. Re1]|uniref:Uncharacterized protein n=1 Tax=Microbacterium commune TaxID=2762219 RepID=A0ABR8W6S7_9MICO|nr:hypothetical protein [Microbacterium commune]MBD8012658.1 hypothetical protein [Microbacterium commune]
MSNEAKRIARNSELADRMIAAYVHRAGSEDPLTYLTEFVESMDSEQEAVDRLAELVLTLAEKAAQASTVVDIWDPRRRVDPTKAMRLADSASSAFVALGQELIEEVKHV